MDDSLAEHSSVHGLTSPLLATVDHPSPLTQQALPILLSFPASVCCLPPEETSPPSHYLHTVGISPSPWGPTMPPLESQSDADAVSLGCCPCGWAETGGRNRWDGFLRAVPCVGSLPQVECLSSKAPLGLWWVGEETEAQEGQNVNVQVFVCDMCVKTCT